MSYSQIRGKWYDDSDYSKEIEVKLEEDGITYTQDDQHDIVPVNALRYKTLAECAEDEAPKTWVIEGVIALDEDSSWWGPSGGLKSNAMAELGMCIAAGRDWRGHKFNHAEEIDPDIGVNYEEHRGVIIFATERAKLTRRRLEAYRQRENLPADIPICVVDEPINFMDPNCVNQISDTIEQFERDRNCRVGLIVFDTWSKCLGGCDETLAHVQNYAASQIQKIRARYYFSCHVASVGHSGKSIDAGERGSSARRAHVDFAVKIYGEGKVKTAKVDKANDGEEGIVLATFQAEESTVIRHNKDGTEYDRYTVGILAPYDPDQAATAARTAVSKPPTGKQAQAIEALRRAIAARGQNGAVHVEYWKEELTKAGLLNREAKNPRSAFKKLRDSLAQQLFEVDGLVGIKNEIPTLGQIPPCPVYPSLVPTSPP
jgi:AAA domain